MKKYLSILMVVVLIVLAVISFVVLPDPVITQFSIGNSDVTTMPKLPALFLPTLLGIVGGFMVLKDKEKPKNGLLLTGVGILIFVITLIVNL